MPLQETSFVLCNKRTGASGQDGNLLLDFLNIILAGLEIDLWEKQRLIEGGTIGEFDLIGSVRA